MKSFIPKTYKKIQVTIRIDEENLKEIDDISSNIGLSRSELINQCVGFALGAMDRGEANFVENKLK